MNSIQSVKQRFEIIGNHIKLNRAIEKAMRVADTDISVLITGESGVGKESIPKIIHSLSKRKHGRYITVNCGAIPEGTIDSELFGHEKGSFTGAVASRSGYFEEADKGTIFLDEVGELPLTTQVRLLRVLENGEFIRVGSSKPQKTNVRIIAATNVKMSRAVESGKFREDLYYRLSTIEITLPPLRDRREDIHLIFRKFASDYAHKYKMPAIRLTDDSVEILTNYTWKGNIRQLKNIVEQLSVLEKNRIITSVTLSDYLPDSKSSNMLTTYNKKTSEDFSNERDILYKLLFDMKNDLNDMKKLTFELVKTKGDNIVNEENNNLIKKIYGVGISSEGKEIKNIHNSIEVIKIPKETASIQSSNNVSSSFEDFEESLSLQKKELDLIKKALQRNKGKRKAAAKELGISERTLYRKLKQYDLQ